MDIYPYGTATPITGASFGPVIALNLSGILLPGLLR